MPGVELMLTAPPRRCRPGPAGSQPPEHTSAVKPEPLTTATVLDTVGENEEVVPVNTETTWVLPLGVTVRR
jgi:hypothetical protein